MKVTKVPSYPVILRPLPEQEGGGWLAEAPDLPGCMSDGATPEEALREIQGAIACWVESAANHEKPVPSSGAAVKFVQRLPASLHLRLAVSARSEGVSLNTYITALLSEAIGRRSIGGKARQPG